MKQYRHLAIFSAVALLLASYNFMSAQWSPAPGVPPANNTAAPINVGSDTQAKSGNFMANVVAAATSTWSPRYCDATGNNCFTAASISNSAPTCVVRTGAGSATCQAGEVAMGGGCTDQCGGGCTAKAITSSVPTANGWSCQTANSPIASVRCCRF